MKFPIKTKLALSLGPLMVLMTILFGLSTFQQLASQKKVDQLAKRDALFKEDFFQVRNGVERMAIETWGYLQVGDPQYLESYRREEERCKTLLKKYSQQTESNKIKELGYKLRLLQNTSLIH